MRALILLTLITESHMTWNKIPPDGEIESGHYVRKVHKTEICSETKEYDIEIPVESELNTLSDTVTTVLERYETFVNEKVKSYKDDKRFTSINGMRFFLAKTVTTYATAIETCELNDSVMTEVVNDELYVALTGLIEKSLFKTDHSIWQPIIYDRYNHFLSFKNIPKMLNSVSVTNSLTNLHLDNKCSVFTLSPLEFKTVSCLLASVTVCTANVQPSHITKLTIHHASLISAVNSLQNSILQLKTNIKGLKKTEEVKERKKYNLFNSDQTDIIGDTKTIKNLENYVPSMIQYVLTTSKTLDNIATSIKNRKSKLLKYVCTETTHKTAKSQYQQGTIDKIQRTSTSVIISIHEYQNCKENQVIETLPLSNQIALTGNFTFVDAKCKRVPNYCINTLCPVERFIDDTCCAKVFNKSTGDCEQTYDELNWFTDKKTFFLFRSTKPIQVNSSCSPSTWTTTGKIHLQENCKVNADLPFVSNSLQANFSKIFREDGIPSQTETTEGQETDQFFSPSLSETEQTILPWIGAFGSIATGILCIITIVCMVLSRKNSPQNTDKTVEIPLNENPIVLRSIMKQKPQRSVSLYSSSSDDSQ